ncbi:hypothetical protein SELMODRAFT_431977 [Selaginella moellendorffii]|uniref:J domain-containing protein n=1 Tax=Selaginella moellendorffii TaxID=88036 RepID=D8TEJ9_SELML|nr:hypothetical protein SELMODRAFT_431977 [Selaginella moellendorffii]
MARARARLPSLHLPGGAGEAFSFVARRMQHSDKGMIGTTVLCIRKNDSVVIIGDGQVTMGAEILKPNVRKVRRIGENVIGGFAGQLTRAAVELAKAWRTDKFLRRLDALMVVADAEISLTITGTGDVLEPYDGIVGIGSGGSYASAAARALMDLPDMDAEKIARKAMKIAADCCIYTNHNFTLETIKRSPAAWNAAILAYATTGHIELARFTMDSMPDPDSACMSTVFVAYAQHAPSAEVKILFDKLRERNLVLWGLMFQALARAGDLAAAEQLFLAMPATDVVSWTALIQLYAEAGEVTKANTVFFTTMPCRNVMDIAFLGLLNACNHLGLVHRGLSLFLSMQSDHSTDPSHYHYCCMLDTLGRAGQRSNAEQLLQTMPFEPSEGFGRVRKPEQHGKGGGWAAMSLGRGMALAQGSRRCNAFRQQHISLFHCSASLQEKWRCKYKNRTGYDSDNSHKKFVAYERRLERAAHRKDLLNWRLHVTFSELEGSYTSTKPKSQDFRWNRKKVTSKKTNDWEAYLKYEGDWERFCRKFTNLSEQTFKGKPVVTVGQRSDRLALGLPPAGSLTMEQLKAAFRASALKWHPDRHQGSTKETAEEKFKMCGNAYRALCSALAEKRA